MIYLSLCRRRLHGEPVVGGSPLLVDSPETEDLQGKDSGDGSLFRPHPELATQHVRGKKSTINA